MMKKRIFWAAAVSAALAAAGFAAWHFFLKETATPASRLVLYGNVDLREVSLAFKLSERIAEILATEGERVHQGQLLARLETEHLKLSVARAEAEVRAQEKIVAKLEAGTRRQEIEMARAELEAARSQAWKTGRTYDRFRELAINGAASIERTEKARNAAETAHARLKEAREKFRLAVEGPRKEDIAAAFAQLEVVETELEIARQDLSDASLYAPSDGVIRNRLLEVGDMAFPQSPVFTLALVDPIWVRTWVSETNLGRIKPGMKATVQTDSYPDKFYAGWVGFVSPTAEFTPKTVQTPEIRTSLVYEIRVWVSNPENELRLGMPATVIISLGGEHGDLDANDFQCRRSMRRLEKNQNHQNHGSRG